MLKGCKTFLVEGNPPQRWPWKQNVTTVVAAVMIIKVVNNWRSTIQVNRLWTLITSRYRESMLPLQQLSDWCLRDIYVWQKFWRKNISDWVIVWTNLRSFGYFQCSTALWLPLDPSCKGNLLPGCFRQRLSTDAQNRVFAKNGNRIQILDCT